MNKQETESRRPWSRVDGGISPDGDRTIAVVIPQLMERRWYYYFLHNQRLQLLAAQLL